MLPDSAARLQIGTNEQLKRNSNCEEDEKRCSYSLSLILSLEEVCLGWLSFRLPFLISSHHTSLSSSLLSLRFLCRPSAQEASPDLVQTPLLLSPFGLSPMFQSFTGSLSLLPWVRALWSLWGKHKHSLQWHYNNPDSLALGRAVSAVSLLLLLQSTDASNCRAASPVFSG